MKRLCGPRTYNQMWQNLYEATEQTWGQGRQSKTADLLPGLISGLVNFKHVQLHREHKSVLLLWDAQKKPAMKVDMYEETKELRHLS